MSSFPVLEANLEGIFTLRSLDDVHRIKSASHSASNPVVVGASFIGMETAASLTQRDLPCVVVAIESVPLELTLGRPVGKMYQKIHRDNGVSFRLKTKLSRFEGQDRVEQVILEGGKRIPADLVLMGMGILPATHFLQEVNANPDGSIPVNEHFQVTDDVYAAGDIASFIDRRTGKRIRIEHWRLA